MNQTNTQGFAAFLAVGIVALVAVGAFGFLVVSKESMNPLISETKRSIDQGVEEDTAVVEVSSSTDITSLEKEFSTTTAESVDSEFTSLNASASSL